MTAASAQPALDKVPLTACPMCSTELCAHGVCRVCGACTQCGDALPQSTSGDVPEVSACEPHKPRSCHGSGETPLTRRQLRELYLRKIGIAEVDVPDAVRALDQLEGDQCVCGNRKRRHDSFCKPCYQVLPEEVRRGLYLHIKSGYLEMVRCAWQLLRDRVADQREWQHQWRRQRTESQQ